MTKATRPVTKVQFLEINFGFKGRRKELLDGHLQESKCFGKTWSIANLWTTSSIYTTVVTIDQMSPL